MLLLKNSSAPGHELLVVVSRACQAVGRLLEHSILNPRSMYPHPHFATQMFTIFILVEPLASSEPYADESASVVLSILCDTVDILTMIEPDLLRSSLKQLHEDTSFQLTARFDNRTFLQFPAPGCLLTFSSVVQNSRCLGCFLRMICRPDRPKAFFATCDLE